MKIRARHVYACADVGETFIVYSKTAAALADAFCTLRKKGPVHWFVSEPTDNPHLWRITRVASQAEKRKIDQQKRDAVKAERRERRRPKPEVETFTCVQDVPPERWSRYGAGVLLYALMKPGDLVWMPGVKASAIAERIERYRSTLRDKAPKYAFCEPASDWSTGERRDACWVQCVAGQHDVRRMLQEWQDEADIWNSAACLYGVDVLVSV